MRKSRLFFIVMAILTSAALLFTSCKNKSDDIIYELEAPTRVLFKADETDSNKEIKVTTNAKVWSVEPVQVYDWIEYEKEDKKLIFTVTSVNSGKNPRDAEYTISATGADPVNVIVTQQANSITLSPASLTFGFHEEEQQTVGVTLTSADLAWTAIPAAADAEWITISDATDKAFKVSVGEYDGDIDRTGKVIVKSGELETELAVTQNPQPVIRFDTVEAAYLGDTEGNDTETLSLIFSYDDGLIVKYTMVMAAYGERTADGSAFKFKSGTYTVSTNRTAGTIYPGQYIAGRLSTGTYFYERLENPLLIDSGEMYVEVSGNDVIIYTDFMGHSPMTGEKYDGLNFQYEGEVDFKDQNMALAKMNRHSCAINSSEMR